MDVSPVPFPGNTERVDKLTLQCNQINKSS
jgi:hypothetical protein